MRLHDLFAGQAGIVFRTVSGGDKAANPLVLDCVCDSRQVTPGAVFAALPGTQRRGTEFVDDAIARGAVAAISARPLRRKSLPAGFVNVVAVDPREAFATAAHRLFDEPARDLTLIGVTGTNGKTTTAALIAHALNTLGHRAGRIGTTGIDVGRGDEKHATMTTPDARELARSLHLMKKAGCTHAVIEVSSHALDQRRVAGLTFDVGVFTNLTRDHLDYHASMADYAEAKAKLFQSLDPVRGTAVIFADSPYAGRMAAASRARVRTYGFSEAASVRADESTMALWVGGSAVDVSAAPSGWQALRVLHSLGDGSKADSGTSGSNGAARGMHSLVTPLTGRFNVSNLLAAFTALTSLDGIDAERAGSALAIAVGAPGRLERIVPDVADEALLLTLPDVFVDYAHTPDALEHVLLSLRQVIEGPLTVVFGCGGDRDHGKRPLMGKIAAQLADRVILTSDNPRSERAGEILADIASDIPADVEKRYGTKVQSIRDRSLAVAHAIATAEAGETVCIAGKGHEAFQLVGGAKRMFDDRAVARDVLTALALTRKPKHMPRSVPLIVPQGIGFSPVTPVAVASKSGRLLTHPALSGRLSSLREARRRQRERRENVA